MSQTIAARLDRPLRGLRLHAAPAQDAAGRFDSSVDPRAAELLEIGARYEREEAERVARAQALERCVASIEATLAEVPGIVSAQLEQVAAIATDLGLALARAVVGDAVSQRTVDLGDCVRRCLDAIGDSVGSDTLRLYVNPVDLDAVQSALRETPDLASRAGAAVLSADPAVVSGAVRAASNAGEAFYDPRDVIDRVCAEVLEGMSES